MTMKNALKFNIDLLGNLRNYETSSRDFGFDFDNAKQLGEFDQDDQMKDNMKSLSPWGEGFRMRGFPTILTRSILKR